MAITTGMTFEEVRNQFDIPRLSAFNAYTEKFPPQHVLIAAYFGFPKEKPKQPEDADFAALMADFPMVQR